MNQAVICVHGFCEHAEMWSTWIRQFPSSFPKILCPDLPGFGNRAHDSIPPSIDDMAHWMAAWLKEQEIDKVIWIGHSMGGYIGAAFAGFYPERIEALVMFHSTFASDTELKKANRKKSLAFIEEHGTKFFLEQFASNLFCANTPVDPDKLNQAYEWVRHTNANSIVAASLAMMQRRSHIEWLKQTSLPIGFISGKEDAHIPYSDLCTQASYLQRGSIDILEGCGHLGMIEFPKESFDLVYRFIKRHTYWLQKPL